MSFQLAGFGTAVPEHAIEQHDAAELIAALCCETAAQQRLLTTLYRRTGVRTRHSVLLDSPTNSHPARQSFYGPCRDEAHGPTTAARMARYEQEADPLALAAARRALDDAGIAAADVTHLVTVSCSGFSAPGFDLALVRDLPLSPATARTHIGFMGCHAALNGLRVAKAFTDADPQACVLVCAVELCSLHHQYDWRADQIVANALFADGAAAVVGRRGGEGVDCAWSVTASGSTILPESAEMIGWRIGDHGFAMTLAPQLPALIHRCLRPWLAAWLRAQELTLESIGSWAVHPGGPRILQACAEALGPDSAPLSASHEVLSELGNMSSPTVLFILDRLRRQRAPRPCVALAFGPGVTVEAALIR